MEKNKPSGIWVLILYSRCFCRKVDQLSLPTFFFFFMNFWFAIRLRVAKLSSITYYIEDKHRQDRYHDMFRIHNAYFSITVTRQIKYQARQWLLFPVLPKAQRYRNIYRIYSREQTMVTVPMPLGVFQMTKSTKYILHLIIPIAFFHWARGNNHNFCGEILDILDTQVYPVYLCFLYTKAQWLPWQLI
jgi:hypothetical protein